MRKLIAFVVGASVVLGGLTWRPPVEAHGGGLNRCGCHFNRRTGECHCHQDRGCGCACQPDSCRE